MSVGLYLWIWMCVCACACVSVFLWVCARVWSRFRHDKTNLGYIVRDDDMHMVDNDDNNLFAAFDVISCVDIGDSIATDTVVKVCSARSEAIWNNMHAVHSLHWLQPPPRHIWFILFCWAFFIKLKCYKKIQIQLMVLDFLFISFFYVSCGGFLS